MELESWLLIFVDDIVVADWVLRLLGSRVEMSKGVFHQMVRVHL